MTDLPELPDHYLHMVLANVPPPPYNPLQERPEVLKIRQRDVFRQLLLVIWRDAYHQGMVGGFGLSETASRNRYLLVTAEERERFTTIMKIKEE